MKRDNSNLMHRLLARQLQRHLGKEITPRAEYHALLEAISAHYEEEDRERALLENALEVSSVELTEANDRLRAQNAEMTSTMLNTLSEGVYATDMQGQVIFINASMEGIIGWKEAEVIGRKMDDLIFHSHQDGTSFLPEERLLRRVLSDGNFTAGEEYCVHRDGRFIPVSFRANPLKQNGKIIGALVSIIDITEKKKSMEMIWTQANIDVLTGLPNRRMFYDRMDQEIKKSQRSGQSLALFSIDLDKFKEVNDTFGHPVGDMLLVQAAQRIQGCVRASDTVARLGGDEFTVILPTLSDAAHIERAAQDIITKLAEPYHLGQEIAYVSASIGITLYPVDALNVEQLTKNADQAMYVAKNEGRNRFSYFTTSLQNAALTRMALAKDLRSAVEEHQFAAYFQPIIDLATGRIQKAEALLRWQHPKRGMVSPMEFIPLAEEAGLINEIGNWIFKESVRWARRWVDLYQNDFQISVNMSPVQFRSQGNLYETAWLDHLRELGLSGRHIVIEITEGLLLHAERKILEKLLKFRDAGIQVAIDDFGTGYSSLAYLKRFCIDYLKIDKVFVQNLETDANDVVLVEAIIAMAHKLGIKVTAEGIETDGQKQMLMDMGCDYGQGYLFSRPVPPLEFEAVLKKEMEVTAKQCAGR